MSAPSEQPQQISVPKIKLNLKRRASLVDSPATEGVAEQAFATTPESEQVPRLKKIKISLSSASLAPPPPPSDGWVLDSNQIKDIGLKLIKSLKEYKQG